MSLLSRSRKPKDVAVSSRSYVARFGDRLVILDVTRSRYWLVEPPRSETLIDLVNGSGSGHDAERIERLDTLAPWWREASLTGVELTMGPKAGGLSLVTWSPHESRLLSSGRRPVPHRTRVWWAMWQIFRVSRVLRRRRMGGLVALLEKKRRRTARRTARGEITPKLIKLAEAHIRARKWHSRRIECLAGSAALAIHAWQKGIDVSFRIGVQLDPFYAHAWVDYRGEVVNDAPEAGEKLATVLAIS